MVYAATYVHPVDYAGYLPAAIGNAGFFLLFSCAVAAISSAIEIARLRRSGMIAVPQARSSNRTMIAVLSKSVVGALVVQVFGIVWLIVSYPPVGGDLPWIVIAMYVTVIAFHAMLGALLGALLPWVVAAAAALTASYCWLGFTQAMPFPAGRYLSGVIVVQCCTVDTALTPGPIAVTVAFAAVSAFLFFALVRTLVTTARSRRRRRASVVLRVLTAWVAAILVTLLLPITQTYTPVQDRTDSELLCDGTAPRSCLFPEVAADGTVRRTIDTMWTNLTDLGLTVPPDITGARGDSTPESVHMAIRAGMTPSEVVYSFTSSLLPATGVAYCDESDYQQRQTAAYVAELWIEEKGGHGMDIGAIQTQAHDADGEYAPFRTVPIESQVHWVTATLPILGTCDRPVPAFPTS
ncbi:hypothetical protein AB0E56_00390 [Microbacterium sp. NPDC028030]|uniref:DUF7224 domain-containing protein n=1 Tax=Microbacterium sp. NPDC028030 TaxID=3155124 RepID=UPI0033EE8103